MTLDTKAWKERGRGNERETMHKLTAEDSIVGGVHWPFLHDSILEAALSEPADALLGVVHRWKHTRIEIAEQGKPMTCQLQLHTLRFVAPSVC